MRIYNRQLFSIYFAFKTSDFVELYQGASTMIFDQVLLPCNSIFSKTKKTFKSDLEFARGNPA